jgi:hypothetical protein
MILQFSEYNWKKKRRANGIARTFYFHAANSLGRSQPRTAFFFFFNSRFSCSLFSTRVAWSFASTIAPTCARDLGCKGNRVNVSRPQGRMHTLREAFNQRSRRNLSLSSFLSLALSVHRPVHSAITRSRTWKRVRLGQVRMVIRVLQYARATWIIQSRCRPQISDSRFLMKIARLGIPGHRGGTL